MSGHIERRSKCPSCALMSTPVAVPRICSNSAVAAKLGELGVAGENVFIGYVENTAED